MNVWEPWSSAAGTIPLSTIGINQPGEASWMAEDTGGQDRADLLGRVRQGWVAPSWSQASEEVLNRASWASPAACGHSRLGPLPSCVWLLFPFTPWGRCLIQAGILHPSCRLELSLSPSAKAASGRHPGVIWSPCQAEEAGDKTRALPQTSRLQHQLSAEDTWCDSHLLPLLLCIILR